MKIVLQITAGAVLGFLMIALLTFGLWKVWISPALWRWNSSFDAKMKVLDEEKAENKGVEIGRDEYFVTWRNTNDTDWDESLRPHVIVGMNEKTAQMLVIEDGNKPFVSQAKAHLRLKNYREKYPDYEFVVAPAR